MSPRTRKNLATAMARDALDEAQYGQFAARAHIDEDWELANAFKKTAHSYRAGHFRKEAELKGLIQSSPDNLRTAIDEEVDEARMFAEFAREANEDGDLNVGSLFTEVSRNKAERCAKFEAILSKMGSARSVRAVGA